MATHSGTPAWKIPWTEKSGRLQSMGSQRVRHDWAKKPKYYLYRGSLMIIFIACSHEALDGTRWKSFNEKLKFHTKQYSLQTSSTSLCRSFKKGLKNNLLTQGKCV